MNESSGSSMLRAALIMVAMTGMAFAAQVAWSLADSLVKPRLRAPEIVCPQNADPAMPICDTHKPTILALPDLG